MMNARGMTLVELLVVTGIVAILVVAFGFSFRGWIGSYRIESEVKQIQSDLMRARTLAMQRNREFFFDLPTTTSYRIREDTNGDDDATVVAGDTVLPTFPKTVIEAMTWAGGTVIFDTRGTVQPSALALGATGVLCVFSAPPLTPDYDCIEISQTRINLGKLTNQEGPACNEAACVAK